VEDGVDVSGHPARIKLEGEIPSAASPPTGCVFHTRCPRKLDGVCETETPPWREGKKDHRIACHIPLEELARLQAGTIVRAADPARPGDQAETPK